MLCYISKREAQPIEEERRPDDDAQKREPVTALFPHMPLAQTQFAGHAGSVRHRAIGSSVRPGGRTPLDFRTRRRNGQSRVDSLAMARRGRRSVLMPKEHRVDRPYIHGHDLNLLPGRPLRRPGNFARLRSFQGVRILDPGLAHETSSDAATMILHEGAIHSEGPVWQASRRRPLFSGVPHRRLNARHQDDVRAAASTHVLAADLKA